MKRIPQLALASALFCGCGGAQSPTPELAGASAFASTDADRLYGEAMSAWRAGDTSGAERGFDESLRANPRYLAAHVSRGSLLVELGRFGDALSSFDAALALRSSSVDAHIGRARALLGLGRIEDALEASSTAAALSSASGSRTLEAEAHATSGDIHFAAGDIATATGSYERALELDAAQADARVRLADCYAESGRMGDAVSLLTRGVSPTLPIAEQRLFGTALHRLGAYDAAVEVLTRVVTEVPGDGEANYLLASAYVQSGRGEQGLQRASAALAIDPELVGAYVVRGQAYLSRGLVENANTDAQEALRRAPGDYDALVLLGGVEAARAWAVVAARAEADAHAGRPEQAPDASLFDVAVDRYHEAMLAHPDRVPAIDALARLYRDIGAWSSALVLLEPEMSRADAPTDWTAIMVASLRSVGRDADAVPYQSALAFERRDDAALHLEAANAGLAHPGALPADVVVRHARAAVEFGGSASLDVRMTLFDALIAAGDRAEAERVLNDAARLYPSAEAVRRRRAQLR
ncbi:MAG: tetratricopeptide repeat protein [Myxococcales bacterium]|nr:tetratricopeptide repeat protein [Myxococcales bacterium]MCB9533301.1 tetratricopeptide repeat protein [Myxococcales bacterium]